MFVLVFLTNENIEGWLNGHPVTTDDPMLQDRVVYKIYIVLRGKECNIEEIRAVAKECNINLNYSRLCRESGRKPRGYCI